MNEKNILVVSAVAKHTHLLLAATFIGLLASPSVYAADGASGFPNDLVWLLAFFVLVFGLIILQNKLSRRSRNRRVDDETSVSTASGEVDSEVHAEVQEIDVPPFTEASAALTDAETNPEIVTTNAAETEIEPSESAQPDALDEAKKLLAQQRLPQAVGALNKGLQKNPDRSDLMLQLLDIYLKQNDVDAFDTQFEQLKQLNDPLAFIQAEELHSQFTRTTNVEKSDAIDFGRTHAVIPESELATPAQNYNSADDLDFTLEKDQTDESITEIQVGKIASQRKTDDLEIETPGIDLEQHAITATEDDSSLDDIDLKPTVALEQQSPLNAADDLSLDDFDIAELGIQIRETPKFNAVDSAQSIVTPSATEPDKVLADQPSEAPALDLDFDLNDSFAIDEDTQESTISEKPNWTTDLADESFSAADTAPVVAEKLGELIQGDGLSALEEEFPFLQSVDIFQTRLDLARSYIILGEIDSARELLNEVAEEGANAQQIEARELIAQLAS